MELLHFWKWFLHELASEKLLGSKIWLDTGELTVKLKSQSEALYRKFTTDSQNTCNHHTPKVKGKW